MRAFGRTRAACVAARAPLAAVGVPRASRVVGRKPLAAERLVQLEGLFRATNQNGSSSHPKPGFSGGHGTRGGEGGGGS